MDQLNDKLERLHRSCQGHGKKHLYDLVGEKYLKHEDLIGRLKKKQKAWRKMSSRASELETIKMALELLEKDPTAQKKYDDLLSRKAGEGERQPEHPPEIGVGKFLVEIFLGTIKLFAEFLVGISLWTIRFFVKLAVVAIGISMLVLLVAGLLNGLDLSTITGSRDGVPSGASNEGEEPRPSASSRETASPTGAERSGSTAPPAAAANRTGEPNASGTRSTATPPRARPDLDTSSTRAAQPEATAVAAPSGENAEERPARSDPLPLNRDTTSERVAESETMVPVTPVANAEEPARPAPGPDPPPVVEPVRVGGNVPRPRKTLNVTPEYPRLERLRRNQGIVILEVTVDRQGGVSNVSVLRPAGGEGLDEAAVEAVRQWRYEPTMLNGRPVSVILTETVRFEY